MNKFIDLHTHTIYSDGFLTPEELLNRAKNYNLAAIAIADHDTTNAYTDKTSKIASKLGVELVPAVEFSTRDENSNKYHILGLLIDLKNPELAKLTKRLKQERVDEAVNVSHLLDKLGWKINLEKLLNEPGTITKAHISRAVLENKENFENLKKFFKGKIPTEGEFTESFLIKDKPAYIKDDKPLSPKEAIDVIHKAKGLAILAHPSFNVMKGENFNNLCEKFLQLGIDGFEAINVQYDRSENDKEVEHIDQFIKFCQDNNLVISGGSDFHHDKEELIGKFIDLGFKNYPRKVSYSVLEDLKKERNKRYSTNSY